jgi:hypothetical protein
VIPLRPNDAIRAVELVAAEPDRRALADPDAIDAYHPLLPTNRLVALRRQIEAELAPAGRDGARRYVAELVASIKIAGPEVIQDQAAFSIAMTAELAVYPAGVLSAAVREARRKEDWLPSIAAMVKICDAHVARRREELRAIDRMEAEHDRRRQEAERHRQQQAADRQWREDLQARFAVAGDEPSLAEIEAGTGLQMILRRNGRFLTWPGFADADPRAAAQLCRRLAAIARGKPEQTEREPAIAAALVDAGLNPPATARTSGSATPDDAAPRRIRQLAEIAPDVIERLIAESRKRTAEWMAQLEGGSAAVWRWLTGADGAPGGFR